ncbi:MAG TPA: glycosyltransferase 87 family protein, partial [Bacteroidia bacterium]
MLRTVFKSQTAFACLLIIYTAWIVSVFFRNLNGFDDFDVFFNSGKRLLNHENIYGEPYLNQLRYFYSPSFALLMSALQCIGIFYSKLIWYLINYFALMRMIFILKKYVFKHSEKPVLTMFILLFISGKLTLFNFLSNQMTIVLIWIILESFDLINKGKSGKAMVLMAIGFNIKIIPLFALPWLIIISKKPLKSIF